jgi:3-oxoacyl-(acyl-carrier-protein) synthase
MEPRRVVITGMGTVNPLGLNVREFWEKCSMGSSGVKKIPCFKIPNHISQIAGIVDNFSLSEDLAKNTEVDRGIQFALEATREALLDANLTGPKLCEAGIFISTAISQIISMESYFSNETQGGTKPLKIQAKGKSNSSRSFFFHNLSTSISECFDIKGPSLGVITGCTGGVDAVLYAYNSIAYGQVDIALTGSSEAPITPLVVGAFAKIGATSVARNNSPKEASRPFDATRDGFVLAEGCGILVLETLDSALERGATIYAEVCGGASVNNCTHMTDIPDSGEPIARASTLALRHARIAPEEIDFVNMHGSSTPQNDIAETNALNLLFGKKAEKVPVTSIKSQLGHALSGANSIELISCVKSINDNVIPPTINLEEQDPRCNLNVVANKPLRIPVSSILKTSSGFSGIHSSLILREFCV